jgi:hypothetical protein
VVRLDTKSAPLGKQKRSCTKKSLCASSTRLKKRGERSSQEE